MARRQQKRRSVRVRPSASGANSLGLAHRGQGDEVQALLGHKVEIDCLLHMWLARHAGRMGLAEICESSRGERPERGGKPQAWISIHYWVVLRQVRGLQRAPRRVGNDRGPAALTDRRPRSVLGAV